MTMMASPFSRAIYKYKSSTTTKVPQIPMGRFEKKMIQLSPFENEVRPGVVMFIIPFFLFAAIASFILGYCNQIRPFCLTSVNELFCRMFATPSLASSSNSVNNAKPLFTERPIFRGTGRVVVLVTYS